MEIMETTIILNSTVITCVTIYKPESSKKRKYLLSDFYTELNNLLNLYVLTKSELFRKLLLNKLEH